MALKKEIKLKTGVKLDYWAVKQVSEFDYHAQSCIIWVLAWVSKKEKDEGSSYVSEATKKYAVNVQDFNTYFSDEVLQEAGKTVMSQAYAYVSAKDGFFSDAVSV